MSRIDIPKFAKISIVILLAFFLIAVIIIAVGDGTFLGKKNIVFDDSIILHQPLVAPQPPSMPDEYHLVRPKDYVWTEDDIERWFSPPDQELLDSLQAANDAHQLTLGLLQMLLFPICWRWLLEVYSILSHPFSFDDFLFLHATCETS